MFFFGKKRPLNGKTSKFCCNKVRADNDSRILAKFRGDWWVKQKWPKIQKKFSFRHLHARAISSKILQGHSFFTPSPCWIRQVSEDIYAKENFETITNYNIDRRVAYLCFLPTISLFNCIVLHESSYNIATGVRSQIWSISPLLSSKTERKVSKRIYHTHIPWVKKGHTLVHIFTKYWPILKFQSLAHFLVN